MIKILCLSIWYPLSMSRYFERAMRRNPNIDLRTAGPYTGTWIPWMGGMALSEKYAIPPDYPLPYTPSVGLVNYDTVKAKITDGWKPDIVVSIDAGINWVRRPHEGFVATIATDPHALDYDHQRRISHKFFNMQKCYSEDKDIYLPYAYDPKAHYCEDPDAERSFDAMLIGMPYTHVPRWQWIEELRKHGVSVFSENGPVFDEYRKIANDAKIGLNWSSERDLNARFFETPAFGLPMVSNVVPDAHEFLKDGDDYLGFENLHEAIAHVLFLKEHPRVAAEMALSGYNKIKPHTYDARVSQFVQECLGESV